MEACKKSLSTASLWTETILDSKQCKGQYYEHVSTYSCRSLGTTKAAVLCTTGKRRHFQLSALICLVSTSSLRFHIIYSTQSCHDNAQALRYFRFVSSTHHLPQHLRGKRVEPGSSSSAVPSNASAQTLFPTHPHFPPHLATNALEPCSLVSVLFSGISF